jgi:hypothetical protein
MITLPKGCSTCNPISTSTHWIQHYAPLLEKEIRWYQGYTGISWRVDEYPGDRRVEVE